MRSWFFDNLIGEKASRTLAMVLFIICVLGFLVTAFSFLGIGVPHDAWRILAIIFAIPSVISLVAYWNAFAMFFNKIGALFLSRGRASEGVECGASKVVWGKSQQLTTINSCFLNISGSFSLLHCQLLCHKYLTYQIGT